MQSKYLVNLPSNSRLIVFFTGWSTDWKILQDIEVPDGYDLLAIWDYRDLSLIKLDKRYDETLIFAWSFGVYIAQNLLPSLQKNHNITSLIAMNGTLNPVNDDLGIPEKIFKDTLNGMNEANLLRFRLRTAGGRKRLQENYQKLQSDLNVTDLIEELKTFEKPEADFTEADHLRWDAVFISEKDTIFPVSNLEKAWKQVKKVILKDSYHLPDFQYIISKSVKNKNLISRNFSRHKSTYEKAATVQEKIAESLSENVKNECKNPENILEIGTGTGCLTKKLMKIYPQSNFTLIDLPANNSLSRGNYISGDAEKIMPGLLPESFDLIISGSTIQWFHSPKKFLQESFRVLNPNGVLAVSYFTEGTLKELSTVEVNSLLYPDKDSLISFALSIGFNLVTEHTKTDTLFFDSHFSILRHLNSTGVNNLSGKTLSISQTKKIGESLHCDPVSGYPLTYVSDILIFRKP